MLHHLKYSVTFPSTNRTLNESIDFETGFGTITGPNESGKSMVLEMIRFCFYGTAALRGNSDAYKTLKAFLDFSLRGVRYTVERTISKAILKQGDDVLATGTRPVNEKITTLFGYGLEVFDMAHAANQDKLLSLGDMRPAERKRAVDSVIGLAALDDMARMAAEEASQANRLATALEESIEALTSPTPPAGYRPSSELKVEIDALQELNSEAMRLEGWLKRSHAKPIEPVCDVKQSEAELEHIIEEQQKLKNQILELETELRLVPKASTYTVAQLDEIEAQIVVREQQNARALFLRNNPQPTMTQSEIDEVVEGWKQWNLFEKRQHLRQKREDLLNRGVHICPSCTYDWPIAADEIATLDAELDGLRSVPEEVLPPSITQQEAKQAQVTLTNWTAVQEEWNSFNNLPQELVNPILSMAQVATERLGVGAQDKIDTLEEQLRDLRGQELLEVPAAANLAQLRQYQQARENYEQALIAYNDWLLEKEDNETRLALYQRDLLKLPTLLEQASTANVYETLLGIYEAKREQQNRTLEQVVEHKATAEDWQKVRTALTILRGLVKQYLIPPLNQTASYLLQQMTGGQRQSVVVDEEFDILIDGQPIRTLSGSGKAVANLALRIGLGQVLTKNVMSLFMGDEIDGSMDEVRCETTSQTLRFLSSKLSQILLVTHKSPAADYYIRVGE